MEQADHIFESFVLEHQTMVFGCAVRMLGNRTEAQDIAQETFLRAFKHFGSLREEPAVRGWLKTVTRNLCLNHLTRYRSRWSFISDWRKPGSDDQEWDPLDSIPSPTPDKSEAERSDERNLLEELLSALPDHHRIPLVLYHFDEMSYEDIASTLKISIGKVKTDIHRARHALKKKMTKHQAAKQEWSRQIEPDESDQFQCRIYPQEGVIS
ncbi:MAG: RNA polymerase sigma factor [Verrucomicrobia bacterium]|jgi:RNA polymerase sigma-70 factor, ECF subfamily|nr:RNA polymerase sigma factor [Verrucomicrobiota bacterium]